MRKAIKFVTIIVTLLLGGSITPVAASSPPLDVEITDTVSFADQIGSFVATGPAVEAGVICPEGNSYTLSLLASGSNGQGLNLLIRKEFICSDGSGTFIVKLEVRIDRRGDNANWVILKGSGDYARLHGTGKLVGISLPDGSGITDTYTGKVHSD